MIKFKSYFISLICLILNKIELYIIFLLKTLKSRVVKYSRKEYKGPDFSRFQGFTRFVETVVLFPFNVFYWFYVAPTAYVYSKIFAVIHTLFKRKFWYQRLLQLIKNLRELWIGIKTRFFALEIVELIIFCIGASIEIALTLLWPYQSKLPEEKTISLHELSELVAYEELEQEANITEAPAGFRRSIRTMHHYVPLNPFKATVRIYKSHLPENYRDELLESDSTIIADNFGADSPASFPATPFSRAYVMNRASERVVSLMFAARDRLRLEAQSVSRDEYSRMVAAEARNSGQYAVFDPRQTSSGIALTCGNHCAVKTGKGLCCSCRSMIAIHPNTYVYLELSVTVSNSQTATLGIGLSASDCPLNVMVGSWPQSIGIYSDGQVLMDSHWYQTGTTRKIEAGTTVGMLVYIPKSVGAPTSIIEELSAFQTQQRETPPEQAVPEVLDGGKSNEGGYSRDKPALVRFNINGDVVMLPADVKSQVEKFNSFSSSLYPTVSLFSEDTRVWCRFCEADIVYRSRDSIQAPPGSRVYCLDGSLLLDESQ